MRKISYFDVKPRYVNETILKGGNFDLDFTSVYSFLVSKQYFSTRQSHKQWFILWGLPEAAKTL